MQLVKVRLSIKLPDIPSCPDLTNFYKVFLSLDTDSMSTSNLPKPVRYKLAYGYWHKSSSLGFGSKARDSLLPQN